MVPPGKLCPSISVSQLFKNMVSYDSNMMLAMAVISLILVVAFVFLLHVYAKWLLVQAHHRIISTSVPPPPSLSDHQYLNRYITYETSDDSMMTFKGLDPSVIALIPLFVYDGEGATGIECVICMGQFEEKEVGRELPNCGHSFHVECIDMWLLSHTNCPLCRSTVGLLFQCEEEEGKEKFSSYGDCPEVNISSSSNNHHNDVNGGSVLEIVIEVAMNDER